jgi:hypothetical protein
VGFDSFTGRNAWRYVDEEVDVVNLQGAFSEAFPIAAGAGLSPGGRLIAERRAIA